METTKKMLAALETLDQRLKISEERAELARAKYTARCTARLDKSDGEIASANAIADCLT